MDTRFSLYDLDANQENQAYKMYSISQLDPEFYIQGFKAGKFKIDMDKIKSIDYKRFIMFTEIPLIFAVEHMLVIPNQNYEHCEYLLCLFSFLHPFIKVFLYL